MKRLVLISLLALAGLALSACAQDRPEPVVRAIEVDLPVRAPCVNSEKLGQDPAYPDTMAALAQVPHPDAVVRLKANPLDATALVDALVNLDYQLRLVLDGRLKRIQRDKEKTAVINGCK
jgi:hypothetical protein